MSKIKGRTKPTANSKHKESLYDIQPEEQNALEDAEPEIEDVSHITQEYMELIQAQMASLVSNPEIVNAVGKIDTECTRVKMGCKWKGKLCDFSSHFNETCDYIVKECRLACGAKLYKFKVSNHEESMCPLRMITCKLCNYKLPAKDSEAHKEVCPKFLLPCPNECNLKLKLCRDAIEEHRKECPAEIQRCKFREFGCVFEGVRKAISKHMNDNAFDHFEMLHNVVKKTQENILTRIEEIEEKRQEALTFHGRIFKMENIYGPQFVWLITDFESKMNAAKNEEKITFYSQTFSIGRNGYSMMLAVSPFGDGKVYGKYMSVYVSICRGPYDQLLPWPFTCPIKITLIDQVDSDTETAHNIEQIIKPKLCIDNMQFLGRPIGERNPNFGKIKFLDILLIDSHKYVRDDMMVFKVEIDIAGLKMF